MLFVFVFLYIFYFKFASKIKKKNSVMELTNTKKSIPSGATLRTQLYCTVN